MAETGGLGIALSGGGVLGAAHLGVLQALDEWGYKPRVVAGASAGGLVAGGLGAGVPLADLTAFYRHVCAVPHWYELRAIAAEEYTAVRTGDRLGLASLSPMLGALSAHARPSVGDWTPGHAVMTVDIGGANGLVTVHSGMGDSARWTTVAALQATSALPGLFAGVEVDTDGHWSLYQDGGLQDNLPVDAAFDLGAARVLSVNVGGSLPMPPIARPISLLEVVQRAVCYGTAKLTADTNPRRGPVLPVNPTLPHGTSLLSFRNFEGLLNAGYQAAVERRAEIEQFLGGHEAVA